LQGARRPVSNRDVRVVRVLLDAGADPRRYCDDDRQPTSVIPAAISSGCGVELIELLLARGADPVGRGPDGRSPYQLAIAQGRGDLAAAVLRDHTGES
jgi:ankyrin repeat protein